MPSQGTTPGLDRTVRRESDRTKRTDRSFVKALMARSRGWFAGKPPVELAEIIERPARTADRYFTGERLPDAVACIRIIRSRVGPQFMGEVVRGLSLEERTAIARAALTAADSL